MVEELVIRIAKEALFMVLIISGPPIFMSLIVGLIISIFQAATQIQEQTLTFVPKLIAVYGTILALGSWFLAQIVNFATNLLTSFPKFVH